MEDLNFHKVKKIFFLISFFLVHSVYSFAQNFSLEEQVKLNDPWGSSFLNNNEERFGIVFNNKVTDLTGQINNIKSLKELIQFNDITIDSKSGYSGAGRRVHQKFKDKNLYESLSAYGVGFHRHVSEIDQELKTISKKKINFIFTSSSNRIFLNTK